MSRRNVEVVRQAYKLINRDAFDPAADLDLGLFTPDVELDRSDAPLDGSVYRGHDGPRIQTFQSKSEALEAAGLSD